MEIHRICQAQKSDSLAISRFLSTASFVHKHLDWKDVLEWVEEEPFLLHFNGDRLTGILSCAADPPGVNWIHCYAALHQTDLQETFTGFLTELQQKYRHSVTSLFSVGLQDPFCKLLEKTGFSNKQNIVVLAWNGESPPVLRCPPGILVRSMEPSDLEGVHRLDKLVFEPIWRFSESALHRAFLQSERATVAEEDDQIIGYELTTANHFSAHLARLAVHPVYQRRNIGTTLMKEMMDSFQRSGRRQITVNTQDNNASSIALYQKMNFQLSGDTFPVYTLKLN